MKNGSSPTTSNSQSPASITIQKCPNPSEGLSESEEPSAKRFQLLSSIIEKKLQEKENVSNKIPPEEEEVDRYFSATHIIDDKVDPVIFWLQQDKNYPLLSTVAKDVLVIPGSSAPVERVFSTAGDSTCGKQNHLSDKNLEHKVILRKNRKYL